MILYVRLNLKGFYLIKKSKEENVKKNLIQKLLKLIEF